MYQSFRKGLYWYHETEDLFNSDFKSTRRGSFENPILIPILSKVKSKVGKVIPKIKKLIKELNFNPQSVASDSNTRRFWVVDTRLDLSFQKEILDSYGWAAYSLSSSPGNNTLEFILKQLDQDKSSYLCNIGAKLDTPALGIDKLWKLRALGGFGGIGRSCYLLMIGDKKIILDAGVQPTKSGNLYPDFTEFIHINEVDCILLSHAHYDHSGFLPFIVKAGYSGPIITTINSLHLTWNTLMTTLNIEGINAGFNEEDIQAVLNHTEICKIGEPFYLFGLRIDFYHASHLAGSAMIRITDVNKNKSILYTGDFKLSNQNKILKMVDNSIFKNQYHTVLSEATYAQAAPNVSSLKEIEKLKKIINQAVNNNEAVLFPVLTFGREDMILIVLEIYSDRINAGLPVIPIYIDKSIRNQIYSLRQWSESVNQSIVNHLIQLIQKYTIITPPDLSIANIIISGSGMLEGGEVVRYLSYILRNSGNHLIFSVFQAHKTLGQQIKNKELIEYPDPYSGRDIPIKCSIHEIKFSGHTTYSGLISFFDRLKISKRLILTHGNLVHLSILASTLNKKYASHTIKNFLTVAPFLGDTLII